VSVDDIFVHVGWVRGKVLPRKAVLRVSRCTQELHECENSDLGSSQRRCPTRNLLAAAQALDLAFTPNRCKKMWLQACSNFYAAPENPAVVVARQIGCTKELCDQTPYYSNCVQDSDCANIPDVNSGPPEVGSHWPFSQHYSTTLAHYKPCCSFYNNYCNGASCLGRDGIGPVCPATDAEENNFCIKRDKLGGNVNLDCWLAGGVSTLSASTAGLAALVVSLFTTLLIYH